MDAIFLCGLCLLRIWSAAVLIPKAFRQQDSSNATTVSRQHSQGLAFKRVMWDRFRWLTVLVSYRLSTMHDWRGRHLATSANTALFFCNMFQSTKSRAYLTSLWIKRIFKAHLFWWNNAKKLGCFVINISRVAHSKLQSVQITHTKLITYLDGLHKRIRLCAHISRPDSV